MSSESAIILILNTRKKVTIINRLKAILLGIELFLVLTLILSVDVTLFSTLIIIAISVHASILMHQVEDYYANLDAPKQ